MFLECNSYKYYSIDIPYVCHKLFKIYRKIQNVQTLQTEIVSLTLSLIIAQ